MAFDIITIEPTTVDGAHEAGDVCFNLTSFQIPARACKLVNAFMEVAAGGGEGDTKISLLFFQKNTQPTLGTLDATADISASDFTSNQYIGASFLMLDDGGFDLDAVDTTGLYYQVPAMNSNTGSRGTGSSDELVLKGDAGSTDLFVGGIVHFGAPDFDGTDNVKIHLHVEY